MHVKQQTVAMYLWSFATKLRPSIVILCHSHSPSTGLSTHVTGNTTRPTGGVQLHNFRSVGMQTHARADALLMQQGAEVHVTVVTKNAAGLTTAIYSDPLTIDLTPPVLCCITVSFCVDLLNICLIFVQSWTNKS